MAKQDRSAHREKAQAQAECAKFLNTVGRAEKHRDGVQGQCRACGSWVTLIQHTDIGVADYSAVIPTAHGPIGYVVEVKAGGDSFPMKRIEDEQLQWMIKWSLTTGGEAWFWLQMGTDPVNKVSPFSRRVWLIPVWELDATRQLINNILGGKQDVLYISRELPRQRYGDVYREYGMYANELFAEYRLTHEGGGLWRPVPNHPFIKLYGEGNYAKRSA